MKLYHQIDCFSLHFKFWKFIGLYPGKEMSKYYKIYSFFFLTFFVKLYVFVSSINFCFAPAEMEIFIDDTIFYFSEMVVLIKVLTFILMKNKILLLLDTLESDIFQPESKDGLKIIIEAKKNNVFYWKLLTALGYSSNTSYSFSPLLAHFIFGININLPICSYSFIPETVRDKYFYQLYAYQLLGIHLQMLIYMNVHCFFVGCLNFIVAQLDVLDNNLRKSADMIILEDDSTESRKIFKPHNDDYCVRKLNKCIIHFDKVAEFCEHVEEVFSVIVFVSFSVAATTICVAIFRLTLPSTTITDYIILGYVFMITGGTFVLCFLGTQVDAKSSDLSFAAYSCNWTNRSRRFKSSLRIFTERTSRPLTIVGLRMFPLTLVTFTSIMKSAYSFYTMLRFMQSRESTTYG